MLSAAPVLIGINAHPGARREKFMDAAIFPVASLETGLLVFLPVTPLGRMAQASRPVLVRR